MIISLLHRALADAYPVAITPDLPTSSALLLSYYTASLILVARSLEESGEGLSSETLSSPRKFDGPSIHGEERSGASVQLGAELSPSRAVLRASIVKYAKATLEAALSMSLLLRETLSINRCLCIGYSTLIVAFYDETQSGLPDEQCSDLLTRLGEWSQTIPGKPWVANFTILARRSLLTRMQRKRTGAGLDLVSTDVRAGPAESHAANCTESLVPSEADGNSREEADGWEVHPSPGGPSYDDTFTAHFPMMEDIFSGSFPTDLGYPWWT